MNKFPHYSADSLVRMFMRNWHETKHPTGKPLWARVMDTFAVGSTVARDICMRYDMDPDILVKQRRL